MNNTKVVPGDKWNQDKLNEIINSFFPVFVKKQTIRDDDCNICKNFMKDIGEKTPLSFSKVNQLLHLLHFGSISLGFFKYYFCTAPSNHVYKVSSIKGYEKSIFAADIIIETIKTVDQLDWGLNRFHIDALLFYGNINNAFCKLRNKTEEELKTIFCSKRFDCLDDFKIRGSMFSFEKMDNSEKYLTSEIAYKALSDSSFTFKNHLLANFNDSEINNIKELVKPDEKYSTFRDIADIIDNDSNFNFTINNKQDIENICSKILKKAKKSKIKAVKNFKLYLSITQQLDIYIATSMRAYKDFEILSGKLKEIFNDSLLKKYNIRYFDPTNSATNNHEDKGLAECLMVNCSNILVYFAGEKDSFGKDAEAAIALSLGKPVIIFCPDTEEGAKRLDIFKDIHPLTRLTTLDEGVACGALVTQNINDVINILRNLFQNDMQYMLESGENGLFRLIEKTTKCTYRIQTNNDLLAAVFWNNYNNH